MIWKGLLIANSKMSISNYLIRWFRKQYFCSSLMFQGRYSQRMKRTWSQLHLFLNAVVVKIILKETMKRIQTLRTGCIKSKLFSLSKHLLSPQKLKRKNCLNQPHLQYLYTYKSQLNSARSMNRSRSFTSKAFKEPMVCIL